jgi:hypothetical protein
VSIRTTDILNFLTCPVLSSVRTECICILLVVATKNSKQYMVLGTIEMDIENVLSSSSSGNTRERTFIYN